MATKQQLQLSSQPRTLAYSQAIRKDLQLLEVDESLLEELLRTGLYLKGAPGEEAVLCSGSKTFAVKNVETSNLVLLVQEEKQTDGAPAVAALGSQDVNVQPQPTPPGVMAGLSTQLQRNQAASKQAPVVAAALVSSHMELVAAAPRLHQLDTLLQEQQYGAEQEEEVEENGMQTDAPGSSSSRFSGGYTESQLLARVQCSAAELTAALWDRQTLCIDGRYCTVDAAYQGMLLELVLLTAVELGWPLGMLPGAEVAAALEQHGYDRRVTLHCLATFGTPVGGGGSNSLPASGDASAMETEAAAVTAAAGEAASAAAAAECSGGGSGSGNRGIFGGGSYALSEVAVCLHFARKLLLAQPDWELQHFEDAWQASVPEGMLPSLDMLHGEALRHGGGTGPSGVPQPPRIKHFPLSRLPQDAAARFAALFAEQTRWQWEELQPYVQDLQGPGQTAEALLLKYTRTSQQRPTDPVTYSAR